MYMINIHEPLLSVKFCVSEKFPEKLEIWQIRNLGV